MKNTATKQYNERESKFMNLGDDVEGAHRHRYSEEKIAKRVADKARKAKLASLHLGFFSSLTNDPIVNKEIHRKYCLDVLVFEWSLIGLNYTENGENQSLVDFTRAHMRQNDKARKLYNKFTNQVWKSRRCRTKEEFQQFYAPKTLNRKPAAIGEQVGFVGVWKNKSDLSSYVEQGLEYFKANGINLQYGKSVSDDERAFCIAETFRTVGMLKYLNFDHDFNGYTFAFGARGKAGAVAHFEPSTKVIQINRHRSGALIHEIGHAIDFKKNICWKLPYSILSNYHAKIEAMPNLPHEHKKYLLNPREMVARAIERVMAEYITERGFALDHNSSDWPDLSADEVLAIKELIFKKRGE